MRKWTMLWILAVSASLGASSVRANPAPSSVGTIEPAAVFNGMNEKIDAQTQLNDTATKIQQMDAAKKKEVEDIKGQLGQLDVKSQAYKDMQTRLLNTAIQYEAWQRITKSEFERDQKMMIIRMFQKIKAAAEKVAISQHYDVIVAIQQLNLPEDPAQLGNMDMNALNQLLSMQTVIYASKDNDLTSKVIQQLNSDYLNGGAAPPAHP